MTSLLTTSILCKKALLILSVILQAAGLSRIGRNKLIVLTNSSSRMPSYSEYTTTYKGLQMRFSMAYDVASDQCAMRIQVGNEVSTEYFIEEELLDTLDKFSDRHIVTMVRRLPIAIAAEHRTFKLRKMKAKAKARNWRTPWLGLRPSAP